MLSREPDCGEKDDFRVLSLGTDRSGASPSAALDLARDRFAGALDREFNGGFQLTNAVAPRELGFFPREGYGQRSFQEHTTGRAIPGIAAAVSADRIPEVLDALLAIFENDFVDVSLKRMVPRSREVEKYSRVDIESVVLRGLLADEGYQDLLLNDGRICFTVINHSSPLRQIQLDDDKIINISSEDPSFIEQASSVLDECGIFFHRPFRFISEVNRVHRWETFHSTVLGEFLRDLRNDDPDDLIGEREFR